MHRVNMVVVYSKQVDTMQLQSILNRIQKHRGFVYDDARFVDRRGKLEIIVTIRARRNCKPICSGCDRKRMGYDHLRERLYQFVPLWAVSVCFAYAPRRCDCPLCGVLVELLPWAEGKQRMTTALVWFLASWAKVLSWKETAARFGVSWQTVFTAVDAAVTWGRLHQRLRPDEARRLRVDGDDVTLKNSRWFLLKRKESLSNQLFRRPNELKTANTDTLSAYLLKEQFRDFWGYQSTVWAGKFLDRWIGEAGGTGLKPFCRLAKTLHDHRSLLLNWFRAREAYAAGAVEGFNWAQSPDSG